VGLHITDQHSCVWTPRGGYLVESRERGGEAVPREELADESIGNRASIEWRHGSADISIGKKDAVAPPALVGVHRLARKMLLRLFVGCTQRPQRSSIRLKK